MLTALDIQNQEFRRGMRGYNEEDVDSFLDEVISDYQSLIDQNNLLKSQLEEANKKIAEYKSTEGSVLTTLESAKILMNDIAASAEKRADILVKNAELDVELKLRQANDDIAQLKAEEANLHNRVASIKSRMKDILESELSKIDNLEMNIFGE